MMDLDPDSLVTPPDLPWCYPQHRRPLLLDLLDPDLPWSLTRAFPGATRSIDAPCRSGPSSPLPAAAAALPSALAARPPARCLSPDSRSPSPPIPSWASRSCSSDWRRCRCCSERSGSHTWGGGGMEWGGKYEVRVRAQRAHNPNMNNQCTMTNPHPLRSTLQARPRQSCTLPPAHRPLVILHPTRALLTTV